MLSLKLRNLYVPGWVFFFLRVDYVSSTLVFLVIDNNISLEHFPITFDDQKIRDRVLVIKNLICNLFSPKNPLKAF